MIYRTWRMFDNRVAFCLWAAFFIFLLVNCRSLRIFGWGLRPPKTFPVILRRSLEARFRFCLHRSRWLCREKIEIAFVPFPVTQGFLGVFYPLAFFHHSIELKSRIIFCTRAALTSSSSIWRSSSKVSAWPLAPVSLVFVFLTPESEFYLITPFKCISTWCYVVFICWSILLIKLLYHKTSTFQITIHF